MYLHGSKEFNYDLGEELGLSEKQMENFKYALYEVELDVEIDEEGNATILKVDGVALQK